MKKAKHLLFLLMAFMMVACSNDSVSDFTISNGGGEDIDNPDGTTINYTDNIRPIMQNACVGCHANPPVNGAPFSLVNFSQVNQQASAILSAMSKQSGAAGAMPPAGRLPQPTIDIIQQWINNGKPEN